MTMNVYEYYAHRAALERAGSEVRRARTRPALRITLEVPAWLTWQRAAVAAGLAGLTYAAVALPEVPAEAAVAGYAGVGLVWLACRATRWARYRARMWAHAWSGQPLGKEGIRALMR